MHALGNSFNGQLDLVDVAVGRLGGVGRVGYKLLDGDLRLGLDAFVAAAISLGMAS